MVKIESHKNWNLGSNLRFSEVIAFVMLYKKMHAFHGGSDFRLNDIPVIKLSSVSQCLMSVFFL